MAVRFPLAWRAGDVLYTITTYEQNTRISKAELLAIAESIGPQAPALQREASQYLGCLFDFARLRPDAMCSECLKTCQLCATILLRPARVAGRRA